MTNLFCIFIQQYEYYQKMRNELGANPTPETILKLRKKAESYRSKALDLLRKYSSGD